jgi:hypothetical protein
MEQKRIQFDEFARNLPTILDTLARQHEAVLVERKGKLYTVAPQEPEPADVWAAYDPQRTRAALRASAGALAGVDRDELLADIHAQRAQKSRRRKT